MMCMHCIWHREVAPTSIYEFCSRLCSKAPLQFARITVLMNNVLASNHVRVQFNKRVLVWHASWKLSAWSGSSHHRKGCPEGNGHQCIIHVVHVLHACISINFALKRPWLKKHQRNFPACSHGHVRSTSLWSDTEAPTLQLQTPKCLWKWSFTLEYGRCPQDHF